MALFFVILLIHVRSSNYITETHTDHILNEAAFPIFDKRSPAASQEGAVLVINAGTTEPFSRIIANHGICLAMLRVIVIFGVHFDEAGAGLAWRCGVVWGEELVRPASFCQRQIAITTETLSETENGTKVHARGKGSKWVTYLWSSFVIC